MNGRLYWKQKAPLILLHMICMVGLAVFLYLNNNSRDSIVLILGIWILILAGSLGKAWLERKKQMDKLLSLAEQLEERYLISEVMEKPKQADDQVFYRVLKMADKSMIEQVSEVKRERNEYKEYIEQWIHEIKTPITAMKLLCENHPSLYTKDLLVELEKTNRYTEQALYYARSEHTQKDYSVRKISLTEVVHQAIAQNKYLLLHHQVSIEVQENMTPVFSDEKWLCFILNQLIVNGVKYRSQNPVLHIYEKTQKNQVILSIEDNGIGISAGDLPRIFEKGFTGKNGRAVSQNATGMGLYLCKKLCDKLSIGIKAVSSPKGTTIQLSFCVNDFIHQVQD